MLRLLIPITAALMTWLVFSVPASAKEVWVNCNRGEFIEYALEANEREPQLTINLSGNCRPLRSSYFNIFRSNLTIKANEVGGSYGARMEALIQVFGSLTLKGVAVVTTDWVGVQAGRGGHLAIEDSLVRASSAGVLVAVGGNASIKRSVVHGSRHGLIAYQSSADIADSTLRSDANSSITDPDGLYGAAISAFDNSSANVRNSKLVNTNASEGAANPRHAVQVFDRSKISIDGGETRGEVRVSGQSAGFFFGTKMVGRLRTEGTSIVSVVGPASQQGGVVSDTNAIIAIGSAASPLRGRAECLNGGRIVGKVDGLKVVGCL